MSKSVPLANQSDSLSSLLLRKGVLSPPEALQIFEPLVSKIRQLPESGRLHLAISIEAISASRLFSEATLTETPEKSCAFGGVYFDFEICPVYFSTHQNLIILDLLPNETPG